VKTKHPRPSRRPAPRINIKIAALVTVAVSIFGQPIGDRVVAAIWPARDSHAPTPHVVVNVNSCRRDWRGPGAHTRKSAPRLGVHQSNR
jgi:hypothetical protein